MSCYFKGPHLFVKLLASESGSKDSCFKRTGVDTIELLPKKSSDKRDEFDLNQIFASQKSNDLTPIASSDFSKLTESKVKVSEKKYKVKNILDPDLNFNELYDIMIGTSFFDASSTTDTLFVVNLERPNLILDFNESDHCVLEELLKSVHDEFGSNDSVSAKVGLGAFSMKDMEVVSLFSESTVNAPFDWESISIDIPLTQLADKNSRGEILTRVRKNAAKIKREKSKIPNVYFYILVVSTDSGYRKSLFLSDVQNILIKSRTLDYNADFSIVSAFLNRSPLSEYPKGFGNSALKHFLYFIFGSSTEIRVLVNLLPESQFLSKNFALLEFAQRVSNPCAFDTLENNILLKKNNELRLMMQGRDTRESSKGKMAQIINTTPMKSSSKKSRMEYSSVKKGRASSSVEVINSRWSKSPPMNKYISPIRQSLSKEKASFINNRVETLENQLREERLRFEELEENLMQQISIYEHLHTKERDK